MGMCGSGQGNITSPLLCKDSTMAFTKLADRLKNLPLVLAGPILRQVTKDSVTVWIALKQSATVTLNVYDSDNPQTRKLLIDPASRVITAAIEQEIEWRHVEGELAEVGLDEAHLRACLGRLFPGGGQPNRGEIIAGDVESA